MADIAKYTILLFFFHSSVT